MTRTGILAAGAVATLLLVAPSAGAEGLYLHVVKTATPGGPLPVDDPWRVELSLHDVDAALGELPEVLAAGRAEGAPDNRVALRVPANIVVGGAVAAGHTRASFVVDFDEPPVVALRASLIEENGGTWADGRPSIDELVAFTDRSIPTKSSAGGWEFASRVARDAEGDCTEHAVLLAALARSFGYPARVAIGLALVLPPEGRGEVGAFGHAWAEIYEGDSWRAADATLIEREAAVVRLVPLSLLADEGPGYQSNIFRLVRLLPSSVEIYPAD